MGLSKYRIGELISVVDERNNLGLRDFYGININKEFMPTVADTEGLDEAKYKVVRKNRFVYSGMQTGRDQCIRISMYDQESPIIVSPAYTTFEIADSANDVVIPMYFFMLFLSKEKDRLGAFYSDGSIRSNLDWERFCDTEITLPTKEIQQKYVDIYNAAKKNQQCFERGLNDLKLVCDGYIDKLRSSLPLHKIGEYIEVSDETNSNLSYSLNDVRGVSIDKRFIDTKADMKDVNLAPYLIVRPQYFAYVTVTSRNGDKISIAYNNTENSFICSSSYIVFKSKDTSMLLPQYLRMYFERSEFNRYARFNSWGSARETFDYGEMENVQIPIPSIEEQKSIAEIFTLFGQRKDLNDRLKLQLKTLCPILIKGSILEAQES